MVEHNNTEVSRARTTRAYRFVLKTTPFVAALLVLAIGLFDQHSQGYIRF